MTAPYTPPSQWESILDAVVRAWPLWALLILAGLGLWQWTRRRITPAELVLHRYIRRGDDGWWEYGLMDAYGNAVDLGAEPNLDAAAFSLDERTGNLGQETTT